MNYEKIKTFITIAECSTFSEAAEKLYVSQPAMTYQVKSLEQELGAELLQRRKGGHSTELTPAGEVFVGMAKKLLEQWDDLRGTVELMGNQDRLSVATLTSIGGFMLDEFCEDFSAVYPDGSVHVNGVSADSLLEEVHARKYDIGITYKYSNSDSITYVPVADEKFVFVCLKDSSYPDEIRIRELNPRKEIYYFWSAEFNYWHDKMFGTSGHYVENSGSILHIKYFFRGYRDWAILPESVAEKMGPEFRVCACDNLPQDRRIYMMWKKNTTKLADCRQCVKLFREVLSDRNFRLLEEE